MPINRPDDPSGPKGAERRQRWGPHPDRAADLQERADGAHAEQLVDPRDVPPPTTQAEPAADQPPSAPGGPANDERHPSAPQPSRTGRSMPPEGVTSTTPNAEPSTGRRGVAIGIIAILVLVGMIYLAMIAGVFTVG